MTDMTAILALTARSLDATGIGWALIGGFAVSVHTEPRFTRDVDVVVAGETDPEAERLVRRLTEVGFRISTAIEQDHAKRLATVRLFAPGESDDGVVVDLIFASSGIEPEIVAAAERLEILPALSMRVARAGHLVVQKLLSRSRERPQDEADLGALLEVCGERDIELARQGARLVTERGYDRGRDIEGDLASVLAGR